MMVLQPALEAGVRTVFDLRRFLVVLALTGIVLSLPTPSGLTQGGHNALALFTFTASALSLEPVPLPIAALMVPLAQVVLGLATVDVALRPFSSPVVFLILGSLFLTEALRKHGLSRRLALLSLTKAGGKVKHLMGAFMVVAALMGMWVNNTATTVMLIPIASSIASRIADPDRARKVLALFTMGIVVGASLGALGTLMGDPAIAMASDWLGRLMPWRFIDWMKYGIPILLIVLPLAWWVLGRVMPYDLYELDMADVEEQLRSLGRLNAKEREVLLVILASAVMWVGGSSLEAALNLPATMLSSAIVAIGAVSVLSVRAVIDWDDLKGVSWGIIFLIGAGLSLGDALDRAGASAWFAEHLATGLNSQSYLLTLVILLSVSVFLTNFLNNATVAAILVPILVKVSLAQGISPHELVVPATVGIVFAFITPAASARLAIVSESRIVERNVLRRVGILLVIPLYLVTIILFYLMSLVGYI